MTDPRSPDRAAVRLFPPGIPLATVVLGILIDLVWPLGTGLPAAAGYWIGGVIIAAAVLVLGAWPVKMFRRSGQSPNPWKPTPGIVEDGPYRFTRNPMYLQMVVACIGFALLLGNLWILILTPVCAFLLQRFAIVPEEVYLESKFGETYRDYKRRVRRWI